MQSAWRFRWVAIVAAFAVALVGWLVVFSLPDRYEAETSVFVDTSTALKPALKGLTADQSVDAEINYVREALLADPQLEKIAVHTGVIAPSVTDPRERAALLKAFGERIALTATAAGPAGDAGASAGTIYTITYEDVDRARSLRVVTILLNSFVGEILGGKKQGAQSAQTFLEAQIKDYAQRLSAAEDRLATFKKHNVGLMPSEQGGYFTQLQNETDAAQKVETELSIALSRREELQRQLHGNAAVSAAGGGAIIAGVPGVAGGDTLSRIQETQAKLEGLLLKYTDKYPDVIATRAALKALKKQRAIELAALRRGDASAIAASGAGNSPVYQSMQLELNRVEVDIAALRRELQQHQSTVADLRKRLNSAPQVEAEYQQLTRDYAVNRTEYTALVESYQKARLGQQADSAGSMRFEIVQPPTVPLVPAWPKRIFLLCFIWVAALGGGAVAAYSLHRLRPVVGSLRALKLMTEFPVFGVVGVAYPSRHQWLLRRHRWRFSMAAAGLAVALAIALLLSVSGVRLNPHTTQTEVTS
ncbi:MAG TPA: XrtA system polysaccharide chain length determinant [Candidatus Binataceae bacterium]|nr:XrtA system polysaccharide chain length determinant [Candidatus Binataceae bacterium]